MINSSEHFEKYISHKDIMIYFRNNPDKKEMQLFTSYYGTMTVNGRKTSHQEDSNIEPVKISIKKKKQLIEDPFGEMDKLLREIDTEKEMKALVGVGIKLSNFKKPDITGWQPLPLDTITHFDWQVEIDTIDSDIEIDKRVIERLKFFGTMEQAEMNYIKMMEYKFKKLGIFEALNKFNELSSKLGKKYPEEFI